MRQVGSVQAMGMETCQGLRARKGWGLHRAGGSGFCKEVADLPMITGSSPDGEEGPDFQVSPQAPRGTPSQAGRCLLESERSDHGSQSVINISYDSSWSPGFYLRPCRPRRPEALFAWTSRSLAHVSCVGPASPCGFSGPGPWLAGL